MYKKIKVKWILKGLPGIVIDKNKKIWQLPYESEKKYFSYRIIKEHLHQGQIKYRIQGKRYTRKQLNDMAIVKEFEIVTNIIDKPF